MWWNVNETPGDGLDNDDNGVVDDIYGANFSVTGQSSGDPMDRDGHGTHVAGIIGASTNNMKGVAGTAWQTRIMALKFLDGPTGDTVGAVKAIRYAIQENVNVINASFGSNARSRALEDAIKKANGARIVFVAAAGNDNSDNDKVPVYPANFDLPNVVSIMALNQNKTKASFSNFGKDSVDLAAPGVSIESTYLNKDYAHLSGTSMAAPFVAGAAALLMARKELKFSYPTLVKEMLIRTTKKYCYPPQGKKCGFLDEDDVLRFGGLNLGRAIIEPPKGCPPGVIC